MTQEKYQKKTKTKHIESFYQELRKKTPSSLEETLQIVDKFGSEENMLDYLNNLFNPAQDELYKTIREKANQLGDDTTKLENKKKEIQEVVVAGLKKYFEKVHHPRFKKIFDESWKLEEKYHFLTSLYDEHIGADPRKGEGLSGLAEAFAKQEKLTLGHLKQFFYNQKADHSKKAFNVLKQKHYSHHLGKYDQGEVAAHLKPLVEKEFEIDAPRYALYDIDTLMTLREGLLTGKWPEGFLERLGLKKKKPAKKNKK